MKRRFDLVQVVPSIHQLFTFAKRWSTGWLRGMRISGGQARGIPLATPKGDAVRPATDSMRQAVFSSLGARVEGARFLDLFAGTGSYGLEAISRGAVAGMWVEKHRATFELLRRNIASVCVSMERDESGLMVRCGDAISVPWLDEEQPPDLVFIDPPYPIIEKVAPKLFSGLRKLLRRRDDPLVVFELPGDMTVFPRGWELVKRLGKGAGQPSVAIFRFEPGPR